MPEIKSLTSLLRSVQESRNGIFFTSDSRNDVFLSYRDLMISARGLLHQLLLRGLRKGDELILQFNSNESFIKTFWACQLGGIVPVPVSISKSDEVRQKLLNIWRTLNNPWLISDCADDTNIQGYYEFITPDIVSLPHKFISFAVVHQCIDTLADMKDIDENSTAFIQFSSGSTGQPKGVVLTHRNLLTNLHAIESAVKVIKESDFVSCWVPLTHDMGIIGGHLMPLYAGISQNLISTNYYIKNPSVWLQKMSQYKATLSASPNFGFHYTARQADHHSLQQTDLSSIRYILNGAEPISFDVCRNFIETFNRYGLPENCILPVYGMAEACLAVTIPDLNKPLKVCHLERSSLQQGGEVKLTDAPDGVCFVGVGRSVKGCAVKLWHNNNFIAQDRTIGEVYIKGENVARTYYGNLDSVHKDGWFDTGDLGFLEDEELVITGRKKDVIISKGQNYYPHDLERIAGQLDVIDTARIVFAGYINFETGIEDVIGFVQYKRDIRSFIPLAEKIKVHVSEQAGISIKHIVAVKKIPKTTSGKIQRHVLIENYRNGLYNAVISQAEALNNVSRDQYSTADGDIEKQLIDIWEEILGITPIGIHDNFLELGGDSVTAIRVSAKIQALHYNCEPSLVIEKKTIQRIAEYLGNAAVTASEKQNVVSTTFQNQQSEYSITHFSNDDLEDIFSKK